VRTVSARLALVFLLLVSVVLGAFTVSLYMWVREGLENDLRKQLEVQGRQLRTWFLEELGEVRRGIHPDLQAELEKFLQGGDLAAEVTRSDGRLFFRSSNFPADPAGWRLREESFEGGSGESFRLRLGVPEQAFFSPLEQLRTYFTVFWPIVLALTWLIGLIYARWALEPVERIRRQAERISRSNVAERVPEGTLVGEFRDLARTYNEMLGRLEQGIEDLQNFAADAAHELRTPLATLRAAIDSAVEVRRTPEAYQMLLGSLAEEVSRMTRIVNDLFTLAKVDMRQYALQKERIRLRALLEEAVEMWEGAAAEEGVKLELDGGDAEVAADPVALRRVFMNLVENAVKYNRPGGRVTIRLASRPGLVRVGVEDTGPGIPAEHLPKLFHRFYRVDKARSRERGGAGLGLAICKSFIEAHEGRIGVDSRVGEGTTFWVELPTLDAPAPTSSPPVSEGRSTS
jgi:heavy metal sensor kinase